MKGIFKKAYLLLPLLLFFIINCGAENPAAPYGSEITIKPKEVTITYAGYPPTWYTQYYTIVVTDYKEKPIAGAKITISYVWASPAQFYAVQFYHNGERVSSPLTVTTDKYGTYVLRSDFLIGVGSYRGDLEVRSGANIGTSTFEVKAEE